jgi:dTDP-4-amino-4,6-dideoxygalactose transaminase
MKTKKIWLSLAQMSGYEMGFVQEAFDTNWVAPMGPNVNEFEKSLQNYLDCKTNPSQRIVALNCGTAALHLGLLQLGVGQGDEVLCQSLTFAATANVITYLGARPVFVDSESTTWNMSPEYLVQAIEWRLAVTKQLPKAIIYVNLYGMPAQIDELKTISEKYSIPLLEDAAESLGSEYKGEKCGTFGDFGVVSFNGNKIITTSGGGALICKNESIAKKTLFYATQARENEVFYQHKEVGYNYRMSNISAGIGRGQLMGLDTFVEARRRNHKLYSKLLKNVRGITIQENPSEDYNSNFWLTCILIDSKKFGKTSDQIRELLDSENIETRPLWKPMHLQPVFAKYPYCGSDVSENLFKAGLCLPSGVGLTSQDIHRIVDIILSDYSQLEKSVIERQKDIDIRYRPKKKVETNLQPRWIRQFFLNNLLLVKMFNLLP